MRNCKYFFSIAPPISMTTLKKKKKKKIKIAAGEYGPPSPTLYSKSSTLASTFVTTIIYSYGHL